MNDKYKKLSNILEFRKLSDEQKMIVLKRVFRILKTKLDKELDKHDNILTNKAKFIKKQIEKVEFKIKKIESQVGLSNE